jgi:hypothetical protein
MDGWCSCGRPPQPCIQTAQPPRYDLMSQSCHSPQVSIEGNGARMQSLANAAVLERPDPAPRLAGATWLGALKSMLCGTEGDTRACRIVVGGVLFGTFLFSADWMRVIWLAVMAPAALLCVDLKSAWRSARRDPLRLLALHFLCWMTVRSLAGYGMVDGDSGMIAAGWMMGTLLLAVFSVLVWRAAMVAEELDALGYSTGIVAAIAAGVSLVLFYLVLPGHLFGERLMNWFVYGGWNPVSTGLTFGFVAMWLVCLEEREPSPARRRVIIGATLMLLIAVCFTRSRGALLALAAAYGVLTCVRGLRRTRLAWVLLVTAVALYGFSGPVVKQVAEWQMQARALSSEGVIAVKPMADLVMRGDAGRIDLYQRALQSMTGPERVLFGLGQWGPEEACCRSLSKLQYHLHSAYFATFIHGGLIGFGLIMAVLIVGARRAISLARGGQDTWLVLLAYGCTGLLFDGQTFASFTSIPQMETLLFAFPLTAAASIWWHQRQRA